MTLEQDQARARARARAKAATVDKGSGAEPSILQQMFDVKNATTGESYLYGNKPAPAPYEDVQRTVRDTLSRGYADKLLGPEEQAKTARARERMPDWVEAPTDVGAAVAGAPYRIAGMGMGALYGGLEGAASAYGHQRDWTPEWGNIARETGQGMVLGSGGAKLGEWIGKGLDKVIPDYVPSRPPPVQAPQAPRVGKVGTAIQNFGSLPRTTTVPADALLTMLHLPPVVTAGSTVASQAGKLFRPNVPPAARPPEPASAQVMRDLLAKVMIGYGRSP